MTLLRDIQESAIDSNTDILALLRKCSVLAAKLQNTEFKQWVVNELDGYKGDAFLPDYRIGNYNHFGVVTNGYWRQSGPIPTNIKNAQIRKVLASYARVKESAAIINNFVKNDRAGATLRNEWPAELILLYNKENVFNDGFYVERAWMEFPVSFMVGIIEAIRNRVLRFALEIEKENPDIGENKIDPDPAKQEKVTQVFNNIVLGNVGNIASGGASVIQSANINISPGDVHGLKAFLSGRKIDSDEIEKLLSAIESDKDSQGRPSFGDKVKSWLGSWTAKAASTANSEIITEVTRAIMKYLGI
ncbi:MAG: hypothetical protein HY804_13570 [Nitrospinae bacterium]|nr:hypothetical protein [Nitrospinota bacterium]